MTIRLLDQDRKLLRDMDWPDSQPLPHQFIADEGTFAAIGENPKWHLNCYVLMVPRVRPSVALAVLLALFLAGPVWAQGLPAVQVWGTESGGTLRTVTVNASGQLSITCANCSGSGASAVDDAAFTVATDSGAPIMGVVSSDTVDAGDVGVLAMLANRQLKVSLYNSSGVEITSFGGGTQYTEADTDASITGTAVMFESNTGTSALSVVSNSAPLPVSDAGSALTVDNAGTFAVQAAQSGTWTVQPGNTANTTAWLVTGTGGTFPVTDSGGSLTVDGTVTVTDGAGALNVICDSGCGSGTQYAEDAAHVSGDQTMFVSGIRRDTTPSSSAGTAGDYSAFNLDANGRLYVQAVLYNSSGTELSIASDGTVGSAIGTTAPMGTAVYADFDGAAIPTITNVDTEGELVPIAASVKGVQYMMLVSEDGSLQYGTSTTPLVVGDGSGALNVIIDSSATLTVTATNLDIQSGGADLATSAQGAAIQTATELLDNVVGVEDAAETAGGGLAMAGAVVRSSAAGSTATAGDNATINVDTLGRLWTRNGNPCADHARISSVAINTSSSGNVELVALNGSDLIYVCGYSVVAGAATGVQFIYGTGTACATGETDITGVWSFAANGGITQANGGVPQFVVPAGNAFCVENSGANSIQGHVTYVRTAAP